MISIILPTFNNLKYLKLCIKSIKKNSFFKNQILVHVNEGSDGTLQFVEQNKIEHTFSSKNNGLCIGCNRVSKKSKYDLIVYAHDDMYFCPNWDKYLIEEISLLKTNLFYLSSIMINADPKLNGYLNYNAGDNADNFNEEKLLNNYKKLEYHDFQGSTWAPHLIHREIWNRVGGFSEEFSPGVGSDPDLNMKLWKAGVRIFKGLAKSKVYHFGSVTLRKKNLEFSKKNSGSKANKLFLLKWGITIKFFKQYYLKSGKKYNGPLKDPNKSFLFIYNLLINKFMYVYYYLTDKLSEK